jgi:hypothetical protein
MATGAATTTISKDTWVTNLVEPWKGESNSITATEFFELINEAADMGRLSPKDKVRFVRLKLRGAARLFYSSQPQLVAEDVTYEQLKTALINRFQDKRTNQFHYTRVQNASQEKNESPEAFLDRLRKLCQQTIRSSSVAEEQVVINQEADRRLLAAFINGLIGVPGKHVKMQMPETIDQALHMAIVATNVDREEKALCREDRGGNTRVFTVGGNRDRDIPKSRYDNPRGSNFQRSSIRGARNQYGQAQNSRWEELGLTPAGMTLGLPCNLGIMHGPWEVARSHFRRTVTAVARQEDHATFDVMNAGCWDTFGGIVPM